MLYVLAGLAAIWLFQTFLFRPMVVRETQVPYSTFLTDLDEGRIESVSLTPGRIYYVHLEGEENGPETTFNVVRIADPDLTQRLIDTGVRFAGEEPSSNILPTMVGWLIPMLPLVVIWFLVMRRMGKGGGGLLSLGKSKAREISGEMTGVGFADVGGLDEVEVELKEIIAFLKEPERFTRLGAKLPRGVLLVGAPGTGKTLLARATAGEAEVPFFSISGSDFVEMFIGVGAARVRDLFEQAKAKAPCIVFIDEIDAIGQSRSTAGVIRTNDEREQTLNQLLSEMDGFETNLGIVIMGATNRPEVLDKALVRPGRFDRQIQVGLPSEKGRREILEIHSAGVSLGPDMDLSRVARITSGFAGSDLANIINEAALLAVRRDSDWVSMADIDQAIERVVAGLQRNLPLSDEVKRWLAYHEGGHALVGHLLPHSDPIHKVSIIPTSKGALGYTMQMPEEDRYLLTREELNERLAVFLAGRAAEVLVFGEMSTGAASDLEKASELARRMVTELGMTDALGPVRYVAQPSTTYLGSQAVLRSGVSPETATLVDQEVRRLIEEALRRGTELLHSRRAALDEIARLLQEREVLSGEEITRIAGEHP